MKNICVFLGGYFGNDASFQTSLEQLVKFIAAQKFNLVYGGSNRGLMKVLSDAAIDLGVHVTGVITKKLIEREPLSENLTKLYVVDTMGERIEKLVALSDAFIVFPGGLGTVEELLKVWVLKKIGEMPEKPIYVLNLNNLYTPFIGAISHLQKAGFLTLNEFNMVDVCNTVYELTEKLSASTIEVPSSSELLAV